MRRATAGLRNVVTIFLAIGGVLLGAIATAAATPQQGYSTEPLRTAVFEPAFVAVDFTFFNNWLNANYASFDADQMSGPREHLYYLIDSHVKHRYASTGQVMPVEHDLILELLFSWAEPLGVYGGNLIFNSVRSPESDARRPTLPLPDGINLKLEGDLLQVHSELGWSVAFPYYFMIGDMRDFTSTEGARTQLMVVSTGAAKDSSPIGHSQATLMLIFSPEPTYRQFRDFWERQFEINPDSERVELGVSGLSSQRNRVEALKLHREVVFWETDQGSFAVAYLGNEGTYQWNRAHFLDFLRAVKGLEDDLPWAFKTANPEGYAVDITNVTPLPGTPLKSGDSIEFEVELTFSLQIADEASIILVFQDEDDNGLKHGAHQVSERVRGPSGKLTLRDSLTIPSDSEEVRLFIPIVPDGLTETSGEIILRYPIVNED